MIKKTEKTLSQKSLKCQMWASNVWKQLSCFWKRLQGKESRCSNSCTILGYKTIKSGRIERCGPTPIHLHLKVHRKRNIRIQRMKITKDCMHRQTLRLRRRYRLQSSWVDSHLCRLSKIGRTIKTSSCIINSKLEALWSKSKVKRQNLPKNRIVIAMPPW